jgi:hypothetical protein
MPIYRIHFRCKHRPQIIWAQTNQALEKISVQIASRFGFVGPFRPPLDKSPKGVKILILNPSQVINVLFQMSDGSRFAYPFAQRHPTEQARLFLARYHFFCEDSDLAFMFGNAAQGCRCDQTPFIRVTQSVEDKIAVTFRFSADMWEDSPEFPVYFAPDATFAVAARRFGKAFTVHECYVRICDPSGDLVLPTTPIVGCPDGP